MELFRAQGLKGRVDGQISLIGAQLTMHQADAKKLSAEACGPGIELADIQARPRALVWPGSGTLVFFRSNMLSFSAVDEKKIARPCC